MQNFSFIFFFIGAGQSRNMSYDYGKEARKKKLLGKDLPIVWSIPTLAAFGATTLGQLSSTEHGYGSEALEDEAIDQLWSPKVRCTRDKL